MRKLLLPLLLCLLLSLSACTQDPLAPMVYSGRPVDIPVPAVDSLPQLQDQATLWFRFGSEPFLAAESRTIAHHPTETHALAILRELLEGPSAARDQLRSLFPPGTQVLSATQSGRIMFVTLSRHIMNGYADEPANWRDQPHWAVEVPLRRRLAMQSIAATLTENCAVDTVVILVDQTTTDSLRLRQGYYTLDGDPSLAAPLTRDESLLLTPARTLAVILQCWQEQNYGRLYQYIAPADPLTGALRPNAEDFAAVMSAQHPLLRATAEGGSISADGQSAVFTVSGAFLDRGGELPFSGMVLRLHREKGIWCIGLSQLTGREALP